MIKKKSKRYSEKLQLSNFKLNTLLEITSAINNNASEAELFCIFENALVNKLHIGKLALFTNNKNWKLSYSKGIEKEFTDKIEVEKHLLHYHQISVFTPAPPPLSLFDVLIPVIHKNQQLAFLLLADFDGERVEISPIIKHLQFIQTFTNIVMVALENKHLNDERIIQVEMQKELDLARNMQKLLLPSNLPNNRFFKVDSFYLPHSQVGGDYYDVIRLNAEETAFCIADVSGKGISAALLMSNFQANLRAILSTSTDLKKIVESLNTKVIHSAKFEKFITLFLCIYNNKTKKLRYLNAGHQPPILQQNNTIESLNEGCTILGSFAEIPGITTSEKIVVPGMRLICFTDGLADLEHNGKEMGAEGVIEFICSEKKPGIEDLKDQLFQLQPKAELVDDITLLIVEFL